MNTPLKQIALNPLWCYLLQGIFICYERFADSFFGKDFARISQFSTFAAVNVKMKRHIASWIMLAVFVPMLILSSVHVHESSVLLEEDCSGCVQHHCHGHLAELPTTIHSCVLCQFVQFVYVAAATTVLLSLVVLAHHRRYFQKSRITSEKASVFYTRGPPYMA